MEGRDYFTRCPAETSRHSPAFRFALLIFIMSREKLEKEGETARKREKGKKSKRDKKTKSEWTTSQETSHCRDNHRAIAIKALTNTYKA